MPYSAHRPGRFDSQGRIVLDSDSADETDDLDFLRDYEPTGTEPADAEPTEPTGNEKTAPVDEASGDDLDLETLQRSQGVFGPTRLKLAKTKPAKTKLPKTKRVKKPRTPGSRLRTMAILGGADGEILDRVPGETPRFVQMFFVIAGTALVSAISMLFALTTGVQVALWVAIPLAIVWAAIIFNLDRFLTSTMSSTRSIGKLIGLALPRVAMAMLIGFLVAEPLVLQVFHNDISREVAATNIVQAQSDQDALESGPEKTALDAATERVASLENQAATGIVADTDSGSASTSAAQATVDDITAKMTEQQKVIDQARALYQCELTGEGAGEVAGCTGVNGEGSSSDAAEAQLAQAQQTYDSLGAQLRTANDDLAAAESSAKENTASSESSNRQQANDQLPAARDTYDQALAAYNARADTVAQGNAGAVGLLSQISGLNRLAEKEPTILWAHWLIAALFFMIELLPVIVKVLTSYGDQSLYEKAAAIRKQVDLDRVTAEGFRDRASIVTTADATASDPASDPGVSISDVPTQPVTRADLRESVTA
ncbi:DUF4407 domain-containing protein [Microbacterium sp.]|uniref:DUF4407 domain-containing protein n=1 Tax=Microbacterium sp. TaxID=51671 RepID=UPI003F984B1E